MAIGLSEQLWLGLSPIGNENAFLPGWVEMWVMASAIYALCPFRFSSFSHLRLTILQSPLTLRVSPGRERSKEC